MGAGAKQFAWVAAANQAFWEGFMYHGKTEKRWQDWPTRVKLGASAKEARAVWSLTDTQSKVGAAPARVLAAQGDSIAPIAQK